MRKIFDLVRIATYIYVVYKVYSVSVWISVGLGVSFILFEMLFFLLGFLKRQIDAVGFAQSQAINTDFGFSSQQFTIEEAELVDQIREGNLVASVEFLKGRCQNKFIDFNLLPEQVRLLLAQRLINAINRNESPTWSDLLSDNKNEKEISI